MVSVTICAPGLCSSKYVLPGLLRTGDTTVLHRKIATRVPSACHHSQDQHSGIDTIEMEWSSGLLPLKSSIQNLHMTKRTLMSHVCEKLESPPVQTHGRWTELKGYNFLIPVAIENLMQWDQFEAVVSRTGALEPHQLGVLCVKALRNTWGCSTHHIVVGHLDPTSSRDRYQAPRIYNI